MTLPIGAHLTDKMIINLLIQCVINVRKLMVQQSKHNFCVIFHNFSPSLFWLAATFTSSALCAGNQLEN